MRSLGVLFAGSLRDTLRDRLLLGLLAAGAFILIALLLLSPMTLGARDKTYHDFGLAWIHLSGLLILALLGAWNLHRERERGIWLSILARPISRYEYITGRLLGLLGALFMTLIASATLYSLIAMLGGIGPLPGLPYALLYTAMEMSLLAGFVLFFSTFSSFAMTFFLSLAVFMAGHLAADLIRFAGMSETPMLSRAAMVCHWLLPQLEIYRIRADLVAGLRPAADEILRTGLYTLLYLSALLGLSCAIFRRKELR